MANLTDKVKQIANASRWIGVAFLGYVFERKSVVIRISQVVVRGSMSDVGRGLRGDGQEEECWLELKRRMKVSRVLVRTSCILISFRSKNPSP